MSEPDKKIAKPIIESDWQDLVHLDPACRERFITRQQVPVLAQRQIEIAGLAELAESYHVERRGPRNHLLLFSLQGEGRLKLADRQLAIEPGSMTLLPAGHGFRFELGPARHWQMAWISLENNSQWRRVGRLPQQVRMTDQAEAIWSWLALLTLELRSQRRVHELVHGLADSITDALEINSELSQAQQRVLQVFEMVADQLHQPWPVQQLADICFLGEAQLNRVCHSLFQRPAHKQLMHLRMEKAAELLRYSQWNMGIIASHLGFSDGYSFSRAFRRHFGCSPRQFRQQQVG